MSVQRSKRFFAFTVVCSCLAFADESPPPLVRSTVPEQTKVYSTILGLSPLDLEASYSWPFGVFPAGASLFFERTVSPRTTFKVGATFRIGMIRLGVANEQVSWGGGVDLGLSHFLIGRAPHGLWAGAQLDFEGSSLSTRGSTENFSGVELATSSVTGAVRAAIGYTYLFESGFTLGVGAALGPLLGIDVSSPLGSANTFALSGRATLNVGWSL